MRKKSLLAPLLLAAVFLVFTACASTGPAAKPAESTTAPEKLAKIKVVYLWDADGHIDLSLLRALKAEEARVLKDKGLSVSDNPDATDAYVKITVLEGGRDADKGKSYLKARLYVVDASDQSVAYDRTAEAGASGGGDNGPEYPVGSVVSALLKDYPAMGTK